MKFLSSLRGRVWCLVALFTLPFLVFSAGIYLDHRAQAMAQVERDFQRLIGTAMAEENRVVVRTQELLRILALANELRPLDPKACAGLVSRLLQSQRNYLDFGAVLPDGTPVCGGQAIRPQPVYANAPWLREAIETGGHSRAYYLPRPESGEKGLFFGYPLVDEAKQVKAVVYAQTSLNWLAGQMFANSLPAGWEASLIAPDGTALFELRSGVGWGSRPAPESLAAILSAGAPNQLLSGKNTDGEDYLYGFALLPAVGGELRLVLAAPRAVVLSGMAGDLYRYVLLLLVTGAILVIIGHRVMNRWLVRWIEACSASLEGVRQGRAGGVLLADSNIVELQQIQSAIDALAADLRGREQSLLECRQQLGLALEGADLAIWAWDVVGDRKTGNARWARMLGYGPDGFDGGRESWIELVSPEDRAVVEAALQSHVNGESPAYECEFRMRHQDGRWIWVLAHGKVVERDGTGKPIRMAGTAMDITSRKLADLSLRQRTEELSAVLDAIPAAVFTARDRDCRIIEGNRAANRLYGVPEGMNLALRGMERDGIPVIRHYRADGSEYLPEELPIQRAAREAQPVKDCEMQVAFPDGRRLWLLGNAAPLFDERGEVRGVIAAFADITQLLAVKEALRRNEVIMAQAAHMAHLSAWSVEVCDAENFRSNRMFWSDEGFRLLGYQPGAVEPTAGLFLSHIHPADRQRVEQHVLRALQDKEIYRCEYRIVRADGVERFVRDQGEFTFDQAGLPTYFIGACQDISDQKQVEFDLLRHRGELETRVAERTYELAVAKEAAERANRAKSQFLANISHELRTPLNSLMLLADVLAGNGWDNLNPQQIEYARMIELSGNDLMRLIDDLLDLARIESGRIDLQLKSMPFPDVMQHLHRTLRHVARHKGLDFKMDIAADVPPAITTDPRRLRQLLQNLLSNAIKFTAEGEVALRIRRAVSGWRYSNPTLARAETVIAFDVIDTGIGIAAEQQEKIFEAFGQLHSGPTREYGGTGLGLALSNEIAALLGGELSLSSMPGRGSTFTLYLPLDYLGPVAPTRPGGREESEPNKLADPAPDLCEEACGVLEAGLISRL